MPTPKKLPPAAEIGRLSASGMTYVQIAERFGVDKLSVHAAMRRARLRSQLPQPTVEDRFWAKVDKTSSAKGCWLWTASTDGHGYGQFMFTRGRNIKAHRVAWTFLRGPIEDGLTLDHLCCVKRCVNPAHLEPVTHRVNILRSDGMSAIHKRQTHCIHGHEFTPENTYHYHGRRTCRKCARDRLKTPEHRARAADRQRRRYADRKAAQRPT
jgi:hypothetical protein